MEHTASSKYSGKVGYILIILHEIVEEVEDISGLDYKSILSKVHKGIF